jgi:hypothetical protein
MSDISLPVTDEEIGRFKDRNAKMQALYTKLDYLGRGVILAIMASFVYFFNDKGWAAVGIALALGAVLYLFYKFQLPIICMNKAGTTYKYGDIEIQSSWDDRDFEYCDIDEGALSNRLAADVLSKISIIGRKPLVLEREFLLRLVEQEVDNC